MWKRLADREESFRMAAIAAKNFPVFYFKIMNPKEKIIASLADLKQDIAGPIPAEIIKNWVSSDRSEISHKTVLQPYVRRGFLVSSDSSGLSKISQEKNLLEVMKIVSDPKEIIYSGGVAIGGRGVGIWAADNTQMFYGEEVSAEELLKEMVEAQKKIREQGVLQVGMTIHFGEYFEIGKGFFGHDANFVEEVAEEHTSGGEILITEPVKRALPEWWGDFLVPRMDLEGKIAVYHLNYEQMDFSKEVKFSENINYPIPFSRDFFELIENPEIDLNAPGEKVLDKYFSQQVVILVKIYHPERKMLLEQLTDWVVVNSMLVNICEGFKKVDLIKSNGELGIFACADANEAVRFAKEIYQTLKSTNDVVSIGLASGEVLIFPLEEGGYDLAGNAVNVASKISEDIEDRDTLYVHESVVFNEAQTVWFKPFSMQKSGVELRGFYLAAQDEAA
jgi:class 3 adenylate cyclase